MQSGRGTPSRPRPAEASAEAGPSTGPAAPPKKKKVKSKQQAKALHRQKTMPKPYLALAPSPVSSLSASRIDELSSSSLSNLVLPSSFPRGTGLGVQQRSLQPQAGPSRPTSTPLPATAITPAAPSTPGKKSTRPKKYAAGLLAPPLIMPGGTSAEPRILPSSGRNGRRTPGDPVDGTAGDSAMRRNASRERLREISGGGNNASMLSLGHIGRILQSDPLAPPGVQLRDAGPTPQQVTTTTRRRRRVVRGEEGVGRRLTVSTREEGRALGLARGASMRRVNVWDDLPEAADPPPAFPFPTSATNRLPPSFETCETGSNHPSSPEPPRPRSPPPSFEQAVGLLPLPLPAVAEQDEEGLTPEARRDSDPSGVTANPRNAPRPITPATDYASAPSSPVGSTIGLPTTTAAATVADDARERSDRIMWNADLLAGYPLEERVRREMVRRKSREEGTEQGGGSSLPAGTGDVNLSESSSTTSIEPEQPAVVDVRTPVAVIPTTSVRTPTLSKSTRPTTSALDLRDSTLRRNSQSASAPTSALSSRSPTTSLNTPRPLSRASPAISGTASPRTPKPTTLRLASPTTNVKMASTMANPASSPTTHSPVSPTSTRGIRPIIQSSEPATTSAPQDSVVDQSPPNRRLSRGKAIRRSSSGLKSETGSIQSKHTGTSPKQPLFSSPGLTASQILESPSPTRVSFKHRVSEDLPRRETVKADPSLRQRIRSQPDLHRIAEDQSPESALPPHREAALKRRELALPRLADRDSHSHGKPPLPNSGKRPSAGAMQLPSGPLIDFNLDIPAHRPPPQAGPEHSGHSEWTTELLQLLDEVQAPVAESSSQGAARIAAAAIVREEVEAALEAKRVEEERKRAMAEKEKANETVENHQKTQDDVTAPVERRRPPAPPPPLSLRLKRQQENLNTPASNRTGVVRKHSILSNADSPLLPFTPPSALRLNMTSPSAQTQSVPTRRPPPPPPPPPIAHQPLAPPGSGESDGSSPSRTTSPDVPPPAFRSRPEISHLPSFSTSESSDQYAHPPPPQPPQSMPRVRPFTSMGTRPRGPRGPRPPPPPPKPLVRTWTKVASPTWEEPEPIDITPSEARAEEGVDAHGDGTGPLTVDTSPSATQRGQSLRSRSASVQELRSPERQRSVRNPRSPLEYTDLDVFVSRLEGSGREYEGFNQITTFLGPGKPTAATPAQIASLIPGLVSVDSRRTTAQGKVKLKLSLLGVRVSKCPICLSQFKDKDKGVVMPQCGHVAHQVCATRWFRDESRCFVCRELLPEEE